MVGIVHSLISLLLKLIWLDFRFQVILSIIYVIFLSSLFEDENDLLMEVVQLKT